MKFRLCTPADAAAVAAIYGPFCTQGCVTFELVAPTVEEMAGRIHRVTATYPWLVAETRDGTIAGYVYAGQHHERAAYRWAVNIAVYLHPAHRRRGLGRALYTSLFEVLRELGYRKAYAGITLPNPGSEALHARTMGMSLVGVYKGVGFKEGRWLDVGWWQAAIGPEETPPPEPRPLRELLGTPAWARCMEAGERCLTPAPV